MKLKFFSVSLISILLSLSVSGQLRYTGQWSIHTSGSFIVNQGYDLKIGGEKYFPNSIGSISVDLNHIRNKKFIEITTFSINTTTLSATYFYSFERLIKPPFFINVGAGFIGGIENFKKKSGIPEGVIQNFGKTFIYGFAFEPQFEFLLNRNISLYVKPEIKYVLQARFNDFIFSPGLGFKIYL